MREVPDRYDDSHVRQILGPAEGQDNDCRPALGQVAQCLLAAPSPIHLGPYYAGESEVVMGHNPNIGNESKKLSAEKKEQRDLENLNDRLVLSRRIEKSISRGLTDVEACFRAKVAPKDYLKWRGQHPEIREGYERAQDEQVQYYEKVARKRAVKGYTETTFDAQGNIKKSVHKFDSDLLLKMLAARSSKYRTATKTGDVNINFDFAGKLQEARDRVKKLKKAE